MEKQHFTIQYIFVSLLTGLLLILPQTSHAHWTSKGPFTGGSVKCFLVADTLLYVGSAHGGVYWSKNKSLTSWTYVNYTGLASGRINALASIGTAADAAGMKIIAGTSDAGIFVSRDKGISWNVSNNGLTNTHVTALVNAGQYVLAGTDGGLFVSADSCKTWITSNTGLGNHTITSFAISGSIVFAGTDGGGVFVTLDNGTSWTAVNTGLTELDINTLVISGSTLFAGTNAGIFTASTTATMWSVSNTGLGHMTINGLAASGGTVYAATDGGVYSSADANVSWSAANSGYTEPVKSVAVFNSKLYAGTSEDGIVRSNSLSNISWSPFNTGFNNLETYTVYNSGNLVIVATNKGLYVSRDLAASYKASNKDLTDSLNITSLTFAGSKLYVATRSGGIFVSPDTGRTWGTANTGLPVLNIRKVIATSSGIVAAGANGSVYHTSQGSISWTVTSGLPSGMMITSLATDGTNVFLGTDGNGVYKSTDGASWSLFNAGLDNTNVTSLAVREHYIFAGTNGGGIFRSNVSTASWKAFNNGLPVLNILSLCVSGQYVAAGSRGGVFVSTSNGYEWKATNVLVYIPSYAEVHTISFSPSSTRIFAATPYNTIYSNSVTELPTTAVEPLAVSGPAVSRGMISINPNPNHGRFELEWNEGAAGVREVMIYDHSGREVMKDAGFSKKLVLEDVPGLYFIHVVTDKGVITEKMVIE